MVTNYPQIREFDKAASALSSISGFQGSRDYEVLLNARKLDPNKDFTFNRQLGYISLNQPLNPNDVLAVAFEYTVGNKVYKVGNLTTDNIQSPNTLILKLLKSKITNTNLPTWGLMMKNIFISRSGWNKIQSCSDGVGIIQNIKLEFFFFS